MALSAARTLIARFSADTSGFDRGIKDIEKQGSTLGSKLSKGLKTGAVAGAAAAVAGIGAALSKGFGRLTGIENAEAKLKGLGHTTEEVALIMQNVEGAVSGTAYAVDEAAGAAASAVASGIAPGKELESTLRLMADAATIAGGDFDEMAGIFNKVAANNKLTMEEVNQLQDRGIGVLAAIAEQFGVTQEAARDMVSAGEIDFAEFSSLMEDKLGGASLEAGNTTQGAFRNMMTALGKVGASLLSGFFPKLKDGFNSIKDALNTVEEAVGPFAEKWGAAFGGAVIATFEAFVGAVGDAKDAVVDFFDSTEGRQLKTDTLDKFKSIWDGLKETWEGIKQPLADILQAMGEVSAAMGISTWQLLLETAESLVQVLGPILEWVLRFLAENPALVKAITAVITAWKLLNLVMSTNPIFLIISALALLIANFDKVQAASKQFQKVLLGVWNTVWNAIKSAWDAIYSYVIQPMIRWFQAVWQKMIAVKDGVVGAWNRMRDGIVAAYNWIKTRAINALVSAFTWLRDRAAAIANRIGAIFRGMRDAIAGAFSWIKTNAINVLVAAWGWMRDKASAIASGVGSVFRGMRDAIAGAFSWIRTYAINPLVSAFGWLRDKASDIAGKVGEIFSSMGRGIGTAFSRIKEAIMAPIRAVFGWINRNVIDKINAVLDVFNAKNIPKIGGYAKGGVVPGYAPGRDTVPAMLSPGEGILTPQATRAIGGKGAIEALNRWGAKMGPFGGVLDWFGERWEDVKGVAGAVKDQLTGWLKQGVSYTFGKIMEPVFSKIVEFVPSGFARDLLSGAFRSLTAKMKEWGKKKDTDYEGEGPSGKSGGSIPKDVPAGAWTRPLISGYRVGMPWMGYPGHTGQDLPAPTGTPVYAASAGYISKAVDLTRSYGKHIVVAHAKGISTLYAHLSRRWVNAGRSVAAGSLIGLVGSTGNSTGPHLHFETRNPRATNPVPFMRARGVSFDSGGWLPPGATVAINGTGRPEPILTRDQLDALTRGGDQPVQVHVYIGDEAVDDHIEKVVVDHEHRTVRRVLARGAGASL